jgi:DNA-binding winged helix-turn-helix (wHTH) protein
LLAHTIVQFGNFRFDAERGLLTHGAERLELSPKALQVLAVLVKDSGQVVSKDDLLDIMAGHSGRRGKSAVHVFALRRALGEFGGTAAYIETIPKRGYRFAGVCLATWLRTKPSRRLKSCWGKQTQSIQIARNCT